MVAPANKGLRFPAEALSAGEVRQLLDACDMSTLMGRRNHALMVLLWRTGLRCSEALQLRPVDIDFSRATVRVLNGKGRKARTVGIDSTALEVVAAWIEDRKAAGIGPGPLFCTLHANPGGPLAPRYVRSMVARTAAEAGIGHRTHPHALRHTHAVELSREGWPVPLISRQLGHSNIATTDTYLSHLFPAEVIDRARVRQWAS